MGKVENMTLVSTTILTVDHQTLVIPNSMIWGNVFKNVTAQAERRIDMVLHWLRRRHPSRRKGVDRDRRVARSGPRRPRTCGQAHNLGESSVDFVVRPWVKTDDYWDVYWDITREVKIRFDAEKISIPFPQRDVHLFRRVRARARSVIMGLHYRTELPQIAQIAADPSHRRLDL